MPHFGIVDESRMDPREAMLLRAKVHLRSARRRLREGYVKEAVATLYDAADSAMAWYAMDPSNRAKLSIDPGEDIGDAETLCIILARSGVISHPDDFAALMEASEEFLDGDVAESDIDADALITGTERIMTETGVLPFDESELPPEHEGLKR